MLTPEQYDRLPGTARAIVETDRQIAAARAAVVQGNVIALGSHNRMVGYRDQMRELRKDRQVLTTRADQVWGKPLRGDGAGRA